MAEVAEINILVIEDNPESAAILEKAIKSIGYKPWITAEPQEAMHLLRDNAFAAIVTETRSEKMNGVEVAKAAHKVSPNTNVVVITFYSFINSAIEAMEAGAYAYITKPFNTSEIRIVLEYAVERYLLLSSDQEKDHFAQLAVLDGLTGLYNRRYFKELIASEFRRCRTISLLMIDIDNFKNYNDTNGHPAGDELLKKAAKVFKDSVREVDSICRYGGEEFVVVLPQTEKEGAKLVAERLCKQVNLFLPTTVSIGIANYPADAQDSAVLVEKADGALYKAKQTGKNKWVVA